MKLLLILLSLVMFSCSNPEPIGYVVEHKCAGYTLTLEPDSVFIWKNGQYLTGLPYYKIGKLDSVFFFDNQ